MNATYARMAAGGFAAISMWVALNALYRQDGNAAIPASRADATGTTSQPALAAAQPVPDTPVTAAIRRELQQRGYQTGDGQGATIGLRQAVLTYQFDTAMPLTGEPDAAALKAILFSLAAKAVIGQPGPRLEASAPVMRQFQAALRKLGYADMAPDGVISPGWRGAIERFEKERGLPVTGQVSPRLLIEIIGLTGAALQVAG